MSKHTPEPWVIDDRAGLSTNFYQDDATGSIIGSCEEYKFANRSLDERKANARRIVDCVNACAGMDDPEQAIQSLKVGNEKLAAAVEDTASRNAVLALLLRECRPCVEWAITSGVCGEIALARIDAALAGWLTDPVTITKAIRTAPERIWLQVGDRSGDGDYPFPEHHDEVTWCADSAVSCEVPYVRADLVGNIPTPVGGEMHTVTVSGKGLLELVEFACPDHETDRDQQETEIVLLNREAFTSTDGEKMPRGVYAYLAEYPEEGLYGPIGGVDPQGGAPCDTGLPSSKSD